MLQPEPCSSNFRDFLKEQGILDEVQARALKQALSLQLDHLLKENDLTKTQMAARMKTSRAAVVVEDSPSWSGRPEKIAVRRRHQMGRGAALL
jgi:hypothetical protein